MLDTLTTFYAEAEKYVAQFNAFSQKHILIGQAKADHLCYKCGSKTSFEHTRALFEEGGRYTFQSFISGRRIAYIRLQKEIQTDLGPIGFLELSDQKPDNSQKEGFDHIEVYPLTLSYAEMVARLESTEKVTLISRPHHTTHDIDIGVFLFRCTEGPLIEKIKLSEME